MDCKLKEEADLYAGREQTLIKHLILARYLTRFAHIIGFHWSTITYIDCFSGPWNARSSELRDSSFAIALDELRKAKESHRLKGKDIKLRCFFLEKEPDAYARLKDFASQVQDAEVETRNAELESSIDAILSFVKQGGLSAFPFFFIDPTGWTGFSMAVISPLLKLQPGEVLINFMTSYIKRFIDSPQQQTEASFVKLFGSSSFKSRITGKTEHSREDAVVDEYCRSVRRTGDFKYVSPAIVLHPILDRTHFHLIYASRHEKGIEVFKDVEKKTMKEMEGTRAKAQQAQRAQLSGMLDLFPADVMYDSTYYESLRNRYLDMAKRMVLRKLNSHQHLPYDMAWRITLNHPLVWESDLKDWIRSWVDESILRVEGLVGQQRVPKRGKGHLLVWLGNEHRQMSGK